jgi:23S rRNA pseudouridine1911/1915/1917 synthase
VHALLHHCRDLSGIGGALRPGIVHRLDRGTSGLLVAAKNDTAHRHLADQFRAHSVERQYLALVRGVPKADQGEIDAPIGRARSDAKRFTTRSPGRTRTALTRWAVERRFAEFALLRVWPRTGRTHQIRVHLAAMGLPIAGDPVYGGGRRANPFPALDRQALHAAVLGFVHPRDQRKLLFESPLPADLASLVRALR